MATASERLPRKSVAFAEGETVVDENGEVSTNVNGAGDKSTADSHTQQNGDTLIDDATASFDDLALAAKKKKKKSKKESDKKDDEEVDGDAVADGGFDDLAAVKKKKKAKKAKAEDAAEDFDAKLAKAGGTEKDEATQEDISAEDAGDMNEGTGVWSHDADATQPISYNLLLSRFFNMLNAHNPDLMMSGSKSYKIPPPQCLREGNKKTIFANIAEICRRMKRSDEHVTQFLFAELGTTGSTDGSRRLVIKGKFLQKQIENVLRRYIGQTGEYADAKHRAAFETSYTNSWRSEPFWRGKPLTPSQLLVHDVRLHPPISGRPARLALEEVPASSFIPKHTDIDDLPRTLPEPELGSNNHEVQNLKTLRQSYGWLGWLRREEGVIEPLQTRWIHVSSHFPEYLGGMFAGLSDWTQNPEVKLNGLRYLNAAVQGHERWSKHGRFFSPFCEALHDDESVALGERPHLLSVPFLDWTLYPGPPPPARFQIDEREAYASARSSAHPLRSLLQYKYRLEDTSDREKTQVYFRHKPWREDREIDLRVRRFFGHYPTGLNVDELWVLIIDEIHILQDELSIIESITKSQIDVVMKLEQQVAAQWRTTAPSTGLSPQQPATFVSGDPAGISGRLKTELQDLIELRTNTNELVNRTVQLVNIRLEDHGQAILVFTIVTVIFLPLSFLSSFFGMNVSDIRDMQSSQWLFWTCAASLTVAVVVISTFLAFYGARLNEKFIMWKDARSFEWSPGFARCASPKFDFAITSSICQGRSEN
ncbi:MAG: hypothetical protein Q9159_004297 [Coniocarpon cinnabarinum]